MVCSIILKGFAALFRNGVPHLLVRIGNIRGNFLLKPEVSARVDNMQWRFDGGLQLWDPEISC